MGYQIIRQPDGLYAVLSMGSLRWLTHDRTREELIEWYAEQAAEDARKNTPRYLDLIDEGSPYAQPGGAYNVAAYTFEKANALSVEHGGEDLSGKLATEGNQR